ncbi:MAG: efflux RND transporter periplasmic adaptor subunit [Amphritea sp.]
MQTVIRLISAVALLMTSMAGLAEDAPVPSVVVSTVEMRDITPQVGYVGRVEAVDKVDLLARVSGFLEQRSYQEGGFVKKGDLLFIIEKDAYEIAVAQAEADVLGAQATLKNARADLARKQEVRKKRLISQADLDSAEAQETSAYADLLQAQASLKKAELNLSYTEIHSPIDGQISRSNYSVGNLVGPDSSSLASVISTDPIYVTIAISEKEMIDARRRGINLENPPVAPSLKLSDGSDYQHGGHFNYLDTEVNRSTDSMLARAVFPNPDNILLPGQFVSVTVKRKQAESAIVVPQIAMQEDQTGFLYWW